MQLRLLRIMPDTGMWQQQLALKLCYKKMQPRQVGLSKGPECPHA